MLETSISTSWNFIPYPGFVDIQVSRNKIPYKSNILVLENEYFRDNAQLVSVVLIIGTLLHKLV